MATIRIQANHPSFPIAETLYGLFFEDINRSGDGGLYPELLRNRSFEDSIIPEDLKAEGNDIVNANGFHMEYCGGEGAAQWIQDNNGGLLTDIPAWYAENATMTLNREQTLNARREAALDVRFAPGGRVWNTGFAGVPSKSGEAYHLCFFAQVDSPVTLSVSVEDDEGIICRQSMTVAGLGFLRYDTTLVACRTSGTARFVISASDGGQVRFGFMSLMPAVTYHGHGLRVDLAQKLEALHPAFLRFPGGCIVEGFSPSTVMRFTDTVGPVWERKSTINLWQYRATNGLGFHEYLQLSEDLGAEALYVCNCGMTCQARNCILLEGEQLDDALEEAFAALEYALGSVDTKWGALRAQMGHPDPFRLNYLEIGNENNGPDYEARYELFRKAITERYPHLTIIANTHVEQSNLPLDIADEHFYNRTEWFAGNSHYYDHYDRQGPDIFVGEFAVVTGPVRTQYPAVGEAMFMIGMERNQDIVKLAAYAPLFENVHYTAWSPDLIAFDNLRCYALPSYYVWRMFSQNRGKYVLSSSQACEEIQPPYLKGGPSLMGSSGLLYRNARWNGEPVSVTRELLGKAEAASDGFRVLPLRPEQIQPRMHISPDDDRTFVILGNDSTSKAGVFEIDVLAGEGHTITAGICCSPMLDEDDPDRWAIRNLRPVSWTIRDGKSSIAEGWGLFATSMVEPCPVTLEPGVYHTLKMTNDGSTVSCYLDGTLVQSAELPHYESLQSVALDDGDDILVKIAHIGDKPQTVQLMLEGCGVKPDYTVQLLAAQPGARNTLDEPELVVDHTEVCKGASMLFYHEVPPHSVSVLRLHKRKDEDSDAMARFRHNSNAFAADRHAAIPVYEDVTRYPTEDLVKLLKLDQAVLQSADDAELAENLVAFRTQRDAMHLLPDAPERIYLWPDGKIPMLSRYCDNSRYQYLHDPDFLPYMLQVAPPEGGAPVGAILSIAGGEQGPGTISESYQTCLEWRDLGYQCFVLHCRPNAMPWNAKECGVDVARAVRYLRAHAAEYGIDPTRIVVNGFSNGGIAGEDCIQFFSGDQTVAEHFPGYVPDELDAFYGAPDAFVCVYGARHFGTPFDYSRVVYPPTFFATGYEDHQGIVNLNAVYASLAEQGVRLEIHTFAGHPHGFAGAKILDGHGCPNFDLWLTHADVFLRDTFLRRDAAQ